MTKRGTALLPAALAVTLIACASGSIDFPVEESEELGVSQEALELGVTGDNDGDGLCDAYEDWLLREFAPRLWFQKDENRWPISAEKLLASATLRYSHPFPCFSDCEVLDWGDVTTANITEQSHRNKNWRCAHSGDSLGSDGYFGETDKTFFLQFPDRIHTGSPPSQKQDWILYGHVYPLAGGDIMIQYWQLYSFNDSFASSNHEGDWEYSGVRIDASLKAKEVVFYRHGRDVAYPASSAEWVGRHHVTYVAKGGHGNYRTLDTVLHLGECEGDGIWDEVQGFADQCGKGTRWDSWTSGFGGIINIGEKSLPRPEANWIRYSGLWGEVGAASDVVSFTSGPQGPAYKGNKTWKWPTGDSVSPVPSGSQCFGVPPAWAGAALDKLILF